MPFRTFLALSLTPPILYYNNDAANYCYAHTRTRTRALSCVRNGNTTARAGNPSSVTIGLRESREFFVYRLMTSFDCTLIVSIRIDRRVLKPFSYLISCARVFLFANIVLINVNSFPHPSHPLACVCQVCARIERACRCSVWALRSTCHDRRLH